MKERWRLVIVNTRWKFQCRVADNKAYRAVQILKNEESYRNKTLEVYSSEITAACNIFKFTTSLLKIYVIEEVWLFEMLVPFL